MKERDSGAGEALIEEGFKYLRKNGIQKTFCMLRYPIDSPESRLWHINLYKKCGFKQIGPAGVELLADLSKSYFVSHRIANFDITSCDNFSLEDLADFILRAYAETLEDRAIHGWDPLVSNRDEILRRLQSTREGKFCFPQPPDCCKVVLVEGKPSGLIGSFIPKSKYWPPFGVIGPLGVFPEYRGKGVAFSLVMKMHETLKKYGCRYSYVGTPETNEGAIRLYKKAGYNPVFKIINFEKEL